MDKPFVDEPGDGLWERLRLAHPALLERAFAQFHAPVVARLASRPQLRRIDPQLIETAVLDALMERVIRAHPGDEADDASVQRQLEWAAECNVRNALRGERRRRGRQGKAGAAGAASTTSSVELGDPAGKIIEEEEADRHARDREAAKALLTDPADRRAFELMIANERRTTVYAEALGITHLPPDEQRRRVKRAKDRITKTLRRGLGGENGGGGKGGHGASGG